MKNIYRDLNGKEELILNESSFVFLRLNKDSELSISLNDGDYEILLVNDEDVELSLIEKGSLNNATAKITYLSLNEGSFKHQSNWEINEHCDLKIDAYCLGIKTKKLYFDIYERVPYGSCEIVNSAVVLDEAHFELDVIGNMLKGAKNSKMFQRSRCLTVGTPKKLRADPILKIDEDEVEAGHALSTGTIEENLLYYLNSRGLSRKQALALMISGYLLPNIEDYQDYPEAYQTLKGIEEKVIKLCSM